MIVNLNDVYYTIQDDDISLSDICVSYDIDEIKAYFDKSCIYDSIFTDTIPLFFNDINKQFPIDIVRRNEYSVYKVNQGGYFYVFWEKYSTENCDQQDSNENPLVCFTAYLPCKKEYAAFSSLKAGISTFEDVKAIDEYCDLVLALSSGVFSYSLLNSESVLEIEYSFNRNIESYKDLIVKDIKIRPRISAPTYYNRLLPKDIAHLD